MNKKLQTDLLFSEQEVTNTPEAPSSEPAAMDGTSLRLLKTQEQLLSNYTLMQEKMEESEKQINQLTEQITQFKKDQEAFVKNVQENYSFHIGISQESLDKMRGVLQEETNAFKNETRNCTFSELKRLKHAYGDEEDNIDVLRIRWWPHGYILVIIFEILFCSNLFLILKLMGRL